MNANSQLTGYANIGYQFVPIGNPSNPGDTYNNGLGAVPYLYNIGQNDVTVSQYCTFLNAVAASDPAVGGLYYPSMLNGTTGIVQNGSYGSYTYYMEVNGSTAQASISSIINLPINFVSWFSAARLANWMQNGQPIGLGEVAGSTETGSYNLVGATTPVARTPGATYYLPSENEWFKAAFYNPNLNGGAGGYWVYATQSNGVPTNVASTGTSVGNQANYWINPNYSTSQSGAASSAPFYLTAVGNFSLSPSYYDTFDQNGDVFQWTDLLFTDTSLAGYRGGGWDSSGSSLQSYHGDNGQIASDTVSDTGIRLVMVPEPSAMASVMVAGGLLLARRKRAKGLQAICFRAD
jgi:formylglycine-generating enzyme required for sulfatase activity